MKKTSIANLALFLVLVLTACSPGNKEVNSPYYKVNDVENVSMTSKEDSISPTGLTVVITDNNETPYIYGEWYVVEKKMGGSWTILPVVVEGDYGFNDIGYLTTDGKLELDIDWEWLYGILTQGEYRIVKSIYDEVNYYFTAEFEIK